MQKKRFIGVVTVKDNIAVQSFGYNKYLPLGKPEILIKNLDNWGADEILVNVIDRTKKDLGPDYDLINKISTLRISTPLIYGGGILKAKDAIQVIKSGADRILFESVFQNDLQEVSKIYKILGAQALILSLPVLFINQNVKQYDYMTNKTKNLNNKIFDFFNKKIISELMLIDVKNEGSVNLFNLKILNYFKKKNLSLILFGGIGDEKKIQKICKQKNISAVAVGNRLNYKEDCINFLKSSKLKHYFRQ